jgi:beta-N-acetylhexosaminidase
MPPDLDLAYNSVLNAVRDGEIGEGRIDQSVYRILRMKYRLGLFEDPFADPSKLAAVVGTPDHLAQADAITNKTITLIRNDAGDLPLAPNTGDKVLVTGWGVHTTSHLADDIAARGLDAGAYWTGSDPSQAQIDEAVRRANAGDLVVVTTSKAWAHPAQQKLVEELLSTGKPVVVAAVRDPYDIAYVGDAPTYLATYSYTDVSLDALTRVLFGEVDPSGRLPVDIPSSDDPSTVLYPFGYGLGYGS